MIKLRFMFSAVLTLISLLSMAGNAFTLSQRGDTMDKKMSQAASDLIKMSYRLEGAYSPYKYIQADIDGAGKGTLRYEQYRKPGDTIREGEKVVSFTVEESTLQRLVSLYRKVNFFSLEVKDLNKEKIQVFDVGKTTLMFNDGGRKRELSYGYVENNPLQEILELYSELIKQYLPK